MFPIASYCLRVDPNATLIEANDSKICDNILVLSILILQKSLVLRLSLLTCVHRPVGRALPGLCQTKHKSACQSLQPELAATLLVMRVPDQALILLLGIPTG